VISTQRRPTVVVLRALGLGDFLTAVPALRALRRAYRDHRIVLAAPRALTPLARLSGAVDEVVPADPLAPLARQVHGADVAVNLHGRGPQSHTVILAAEPGQALWFRNPQIPQSAGAPEWRPAEHEVVRWCRLLGEQGIAADPADLRLGQAAAHRRRLTVIHAGAGKPERVWPIGRWAAVARTERIRGRTVLLTGGSAEAGLARAVACAAGLPAGSVIAGRTDLAQLARLVGRAERVVSCDTGIAHLATAMGTPSVTLFGPSPPSEWGALIDRHAHRSLWAGPGSAVADVSAGEVIAALAALPTSPA
jgi:ADP-heptose:LPS heptosyltransferase